MSGLAEPDVVHEGPRRPSFRLDHCEGYRVDFVDGHLGYVEASMRRQGESDPIAFEVRTPFGFVVFPIERVRQVLPRRERIIVDR
jgi:hypothetical protein